LSEYRLKTPILEEEVRKMRVGDVLYIDGTIITFRDQAHRRYVEYKKLGKFVPIDLNESVIFHSGPIVKREGKSWVVLVAGPTTSKRMEPFTADLLKLSRVRVIVGKGGMGKQTLEALKKYGAVYCDFTGGAGVLAAQSIKKVLDVKWLDLGLPEAVWFLEVKKFGPLIVSMDTKGNDLRAKMSKSPFFTKPNSA